jgi:hypothetical protein
MIDGDDMFEKGYKKFPTKNMPVNPIDSRIITMLSLITNI